MAISPESSARERTADITTIGARTGRRRRIEIWFYRVGSEIYLTSSPARRDWYANIVRTPRFTFHLKHGVRADLAAYGTPITDRAERARILRAVVDDLNQPANPAGILQPVEPLSAWIEGSPLVHVALPAGAARR
ncbi:MAG: nitroreductase/quinone reductase family protein [Microbacterium sp.]